MSLIATYNVFLSGHPFCAVRSICRQFVCLRSIFYVFYEQYLTIWTDAITSLSISLISIFAVSYVLTGFDVIAAFVILLMVLLILINMGGLMWLTNISLNAISLVNLVVVSGLI